MIINDIVFDLGRLGNGGVGVKLGGILIGVRQRGSYVKDIHTALTFGPSLILSAPPLAAMALRRRLIVSDLMVILRRTVGYIFSTVWWGF